MVTKDIFDTLDKDVFDELSEERKRPDVFDDTAEITSLIKAEVSKIKPRNVERIIETVIQPIHVEPKIVEAPPQIIKEVRVEVQKDNRNLVEKNQVTELEKHVSKLEKDLKETKEIAEQPIFLPSGPGVIGIPAPEPNPEGYVLTVNSNRKAEWKAASGGSSVSGYTINDLTTLKNLPADASLDDIRQVLGTLITELQS